MPPGWYPDPTTGQQRWWDGQQWGAFASAPQDGYGPPPPPQPGYGAQPPPGYAAPPQGAFGVPAPGVPGYPQAGLAGPLEPAGATSRSNAALAHWLGLVGFFGPLIIMVTSGARDPFVRAHAVEALNFQLTVIIGWLIVGVVNAVTCGLAFPLIFLLLVPVIIYSIQGANAANRGEMFRYPWTIRMVR
jgi:uncharacterized Tic20 family protein